MRFLKWFLISLLSLIGLAIALLYITGTDYLIKGVRLTYLRGYNSASIDDWHFFPTRKIEALNPHPWPEGANYQIKEVSKASLLELEKLETTAFLVIQNDSLRFERYWEQYGPEVASNSFSMAKSILATLTQIAVQEGHLTSLNQPIGDFIHEFSEGPNAGLTFGHLVRMCSGLNWEEHYTSPFSITAKAYYGDDLETLVRDLNVVVPPGTQFEYLSGNTALLGLALSKAVNMPVASFAQKKLWTPLQATEDAYWVLDHADGLEKGYCCFASNARDFGRIGQLYLDHGNWKGQQILDSSWVDLVAEADMVDYYSHGFWRVESSGLEVFYMRGILGQYVFVIPELDAVVVRLGKTRGPQTDGHHPDEVHVILNEIKHWYESRTTHSEHPIP